MELGKLATDEVVALPTVGAPPNPVKTTQDDTYAQMAGMDIPDPEGTEGPMSAANLGFTAAGQRVEDKRQAAIAEMHKQQVLDSLRPVEQEIMESGATADAQALMISRVRREALSGNPLEQAGLNAALQEELVNSKNTRQAAIDRTIGADILAQQSVNSTLRQIREDMQANFESGSTGETVFEAIASGVLFPLSAGYNPSQIIGAMTGVEPGMFGQFTPGFSVDSAREAFQAMPPAARQQAIKNAYAVLMDRAGVVTDNGADAQQMYMYIEAIAGTEVQAAAAVDAGTWGVFTDIALELSGIKAVQSAVKGGVKAVAGTRKIETPDTPDVLALPAPPDSVIRGMSPEALEAAEIKAMADMPLLPAPERPVVQGIDVRQDGADRAIANVPEDKRTLAWTQVEQQAEDALRSPAARGPRGKAEAEAKAQLEAEVAAISRAGVSRRAAEAADAVPATRAQVAKQLKVALAKAAPAPVMGPNNLSVASKIGRVAPTQSGPILADAMADGARAAKLGTTPEEIASVYTVPNSGVEAIRRGPDINRNDFARTDSLEKDQIRALMNDDELFTSEEALQAVTDMSARADKMVNQGHIQISKSDVYKTEEGAIVGDFIVTKGDGAMFDSYEEAKAFFYDRMSSADVDGFKVLKYRTGAQQYTRTGPNAGEGEYLLQVQYKRQRAQDATDENLFRSSNRLIPTNWLDSVTGYTRRIANSITRLDNRTGLAQKQLNKILEPYDKLKSKADLDAVWRVLKEGDVKEIEWTHAQLVKKLDGNPARIEAYKAVRKFYNTNHDIRNLQFRTYLQKGGWRRLDNAGEAEGQIVRPVPDSELNQVNVVFDAQTGKMVSMAAFDKQGIKPELVKAHTSVVKGNNSTKYIAVRGEAPKLGPLQDDVVRRIDGYLGRHTTADYIVERVRKGTDNGAETTVTTASRLSSSLEDAIEWAAAHSTDGKQYTVRPSRENSTGDNFLERELTNLNELGMLTHTKKRMNVAEMSVDRQVHMEAPADVLDNVRNTMVRSVVLDQWIDYTTTKWRKSYGDLFEGDSMSWGELKIKDSINRLQEADRIRDAKRLQERIKLTAGVDESQIGKRLSDWLLTSSEALARTAVDLRKKKGQSKLSEVTGFGMSATARGLVALSKSDPVATVRYLGHLRYIIANPVRQLVMQSSSGFLYAGLKHGATYFGSGQGMADIAFLVAAKSTKGIDSRLYKEALETHAALTGRTTKQSQELFDDFETSGVLESISSHQFLEGGITRPGSLTRHEGSFGGSEMPGRVAGSGRAAKTALKGVERTLSKYGLEAGEQANRIAAFAAVRNRAVKDGVYRKGMGLELGVEALQAAGNMGAHNKAAWQNGMLGVPFQFMSHGTTMVQYMMPNTRWTSGIASDVFSNKEKAKIAAASAVFFGANGMGLMAGLELLAKDANIELTDDVKNRLEEGLVGMSIEAIAEGLSNSEVNADVSKTLGPLSGVFGDVEVIFGDGDRAATMLGKAHLLVTDVMSSNPANFFDHLGPGGQMLEAPLEGMKRAAEIFNHPSFSTSEKLELEMKTLLGIFPAFNNLTAARIAANTGEHVNKYGTPIAKASLGDAYLMGALGLKPNDSEEWYEFRSQYMASSQYTAPPKGKELSQAGKDAASLIYSGHLMLEQKNIGREEARERMRVAMAALEQAYPDPNQSAIIRQAMTDEMTRLFGSREVSVNNIYDMIATDHELVATQGVDGVIEMLQGLAPSEDRDWAIKQLERSAGQTSRFIINQE